MIGGLVFDYMDIATFVAIVSILSLGTLAMGFCWII